MKVEVIENIIPSVFAWAKGHIEKFPSWNHEDFFGYDFDNVIDWNAVEESGILGIAYNSKKKYR